MHLAADAAAARTRWRVTGTPSLRGIRRAASKTKHSNHALRRHSPAHVPDDDSQAAGALVARAVRGDDVGTPRRGRRRRPPPGLARLAAAGARALALAPARAPVTIDNKEFSQFANSVKARAAGSRSALSTCRTSPRWPREAQMGPHSDQISARPNPPSKPPILDLLFVPVENRDFRSVSTSLSC